MEKRERTFCPFTNWGGSFLLGNQFVFPIGTIVKRNRSANVSKAQGTTVSDGCEHTARLSDTDRVSATQHIFALLERH